MVLKRSQGLRDVRQADPGERSACHRSQTLLPCEVMDVGQLRDAMSLRVTPEGDEWKVAEQLLKEHGMHLQMMGGTRVMFLRERDDFIESDGYLLPEEID